MEKYIKQIIEKYRLDREKAIILAVSGGPDSMVLLDLFVRAYPKEKIVVAHANHGLRLESRWDESLVKRVCEEQDLRFVCERLHLGSTSEAEARDARYEFLRRMARENRAKYIFCAHHANDQAETIMLSLVRGSGPLSVWGMKELDSGIIRPLLSFSRKEILSYAKEKGLKYHLDRTNYDIRYARNRIRAKAIPQLLKLNPNFLSTLGRNAELGNEMAQVMENIIKRKKKNMVSPSGIEIGKLTREPIFVQKEIIRTVLVDMLDSDVNITSENVNQVLELLSLTRGKRTEVGKISVTRGVKYLTIGPKRVPRKKSIKSVRLKMGESLKYGDFSLKLSLDTGRATKNNILLPKSIGYNLSIRTWRDGDRIKTKAGTKKLQDVFSDAKILAPERRNWPVITLGRRILWVPGLAASDLALSEAKRKVIKIEVRHGKKR